MKIGVIKKFIGVVLLISIISGNMCSYNILANNSGGNIINEAQTAKISIIESKGWHESAYLKWNSFEGADSYNSYYKEVGTVDFVKIDDGLIREYEDYFIADALGLKKGKYILKVVPVLNGEEITMAAAETGELTVDNYVREGFAFSEKSPYKYTTGAYNQDGTIKENADIIYVTNGNKNTVTINGDKEKGVGLTEILSRREKSKSEKPIAIRFLGKVEMPKDTVNYMVAVQNTKNVTLEGVGDDATIHGFGFTFKRVCNVEVRNFAIMWYGGGGDGDSLSFDTENKNIWVHNMDFFYGFGKDADQAKGDGSIDLKSKTDYTTISYCHFWDSGKALVSGGPWEVSNYDKDEAKIFTTYHHNWFDHSDSRHPRCVSGSTHVYNNYYDGVAKYGIGAAVHSSVFVENNYFRNCPRPMLIATQGSDVYDSATGTYANKGTLSGQDGGMIKEYGNVIIGAKRYYTYQNTPDMGHFDAYTVEKREDTVPETVTALKGGGVYNNFDTDESMYSYSVDTPEEARDKVILEAGRLNGGDFKFTFNNSVEDTNSNVIPELQRAIIEYETKLISVKGITLEEESIEGTTVENTDETETTTEGEKFIFGDADDEGDINVNDAVLILNKVLDQSYRLPIENRTQNYEKYLDVNKDGELSALDVSIVMQKALNNDFVMPIEKDIEIPTEETSESTSESTSKEPSVLTGDWNADEEAPVWLDITGCSIGGKSSSYKTFTEIDSNIISQKNIYRVPKATEITINLDSAATVKVYIAGDNNGDGKGTVTASLDGENIETYSLPGRQTSGAEPFVIKTTKGGILKLTNSYNALLFKITTSGNSSNSVIKEKYDVNFKITNNTNKAVNLTVDDNIIDVASNNITEKIIKLEKGKYSVAISSSKVKPNLSSITVNGEETIEISLEEITVNVVTTDKDGTHIDGYETISAALAADSTVDGSIISIKSGYYKESFEVSKSVVLKKADDDDGEVVIYSSDGSYGGSMKGIIRVSGANVTFKDFTILNNTNAAYGEIEAVSSKGTTAAALIADGDNSVYDNCKFISVQDTVNTAHYSNGKPLLKQIYNNCIFYGATDFICGACDINFNNCEFRIFTGALTEKKDAYVFAPNVMAKWVVNGGRMINDENSIVENFFYARAWESNSSDSQTLDIFAMENSLKMGAKGLMGFGSSTGGGASHSIDSFQFNVYEGSDKNSPLIATSNVTGIDIFEINEVDHVIEFANDLSSSLILGNFGKGLSSKFVENILPDITEIGFVSVENANADLISDTNTIKITAAYKTFNCDENSKYCLSSIPDEEEGSFLCGGVLSGINGEKTVTVVPYVKYDPITDSGKNIDKTHIYKFGKPVQITLIGNGNYENISLPAEIFRVLENGIFGDVLPSGIGENNYSNIF